MKEDQLQEDQLKEDQGKYIHASSVVIGEKAILIMGDSGAGKSLLATQLLYEGSNLKYFSRLVGDDRILLRNASNRLIASPHPSILGMIEQRGIGIIKLPFIKSAVIDLVVMLDPLAERLPNLGNQTIIIEGISLPFLKLLPPTDFCAIAHQIIIYLLKERFS